MIAEEKLHFYSKLFEKELLLNIQKEGRLKQVKAGESIIDFGDHLTFMPLLLTGAIRVIRHDHDGHELLLYFLEKGDTCAFTMACCMGNSISEIKAVAEMDTELIQLPIGSLRRWLHFQSWQEFIFESYNTRLNEMLKAIDALAFQQLDERLLVFLQNKTLLNKSGQIRCSHQEIAQALNSSRVVISRLLKRLEKEGKLILHRNKIELTQP